MTFRSVLIGLLLGCAIACFGYFNDWIMKQAYLATNLIPTGVFGVLILALLFGNPLLKLLRLASYTASEWCVIAAVALVACVVPGPGLMWHFSNVLVTPHRAYATDAGWWKHRVMDYAPPVMLVDPGQKGTDDRTGRDHTTVVGAFKGGGTEVPWHAWKRTLTFWLPLFALSFIGGISLVMLVHPQWSKRERLRYPTAYVASELVSGWGEPQKPGILRDRRFWLGFAISACILMLNGYYQWNSNSIRIPLSVSVLSQFGRKWPIVYKYTYDWILFAPAVYFSAVGFAYFVSSEISFSLGISGIVHAAVFLSLTVAGIDMTGGGLEGSKYNFQMFGTYLGVALVILYTGRRFYGSVFARAFGLWTGDPVERHVAWACRIALLAGVAMVLMLVFGLGMDWLLATLFVLLSGMMFVVVTRINVETGLFMIQPGWYAVMVLFGVLGFAAIGPHMLVMLGILCVVMTLDPIVCLMPLAANALRLGELAKVKPSRLSPWLVVSVVLALVIGVTVTIGFQYAHGGTQYGWADTVAKNPFKLIQRELAKGTTDFGDRDKVQGLDLAKMHPKRDALYSMAIGLAIALGLSALRLRFTWWPIHPVLFMIWGTFPGMILAVSFFLGWLLKTGISTFGGGRAYRSAKPIFIGLIAGEFAAGILWTLVGAAYYLIEGVPGKKFLIYPS